MTRTRTLAAGATAAVLALTLSACSDDSGPDPKDPTTGSNKSSTSQPTADLKDRSKQVFDRVKEPKTLGTAEGSVKTARGSEGQVLFEVTEVTATPEATLLRYQLTAQNDTEGLWWVAGRYWFDQPTLQAPGSDTKLQSVTGAVPIDGDTEDRCVCTSVRFAGPDPRSQTTLYPPLPEDATKVKVTLPGLDPVTVPITR